MPSSSFHTLCSSFYLILKTDIFYLFFIVNFSIFYICDSWLLQYFFLFLFSYYVYCYVPKHRGKSLVLYVKTYLAISPILVFTAHSEFCGASVKNWITTKLLISKVQCYLFKNHSHRAMNQTANHYKLKEATFEIQYDEAMQLVPLTNLHTELFKWQAGETDGLCLHSDPNYQNTSLTTCSVITFTMSVK